ncbi:hypothetical protein P7K49_026888, partial [Saguinus oedipus]
MIPLNLLIGLQNQYWDDGQQNGHDDTPNQGPDVQALGGGGLGLGPGQFANYLPVPRLHGVGEMKPRQQEFMKRVLNRDQTMWSSMEVSLRMWITVDAG